MPSFWRSVLLSFSLKLETFVFPDPPGYAWAIGKSECPWRLPLIYKTATTGDLDPGDNDKWLAQIVASIWFEDDFMDSFIHSSNN